LSGTWAVCKREFAAYFLSPVGYVVVGSIAAIAGLAFTFSFLSYAEVSQDPTRFNYATVPDFEEFFLSPYLRFAGILLMFLSPLITMRLLAEEHNRGTMELLLTLPLRDRDIIFGKYFAALGMVLVLLLVFSVNLGLIGYFAAVESAVLGLGLVTVFLMGAAVISLGLFISALTRNQITAGTLTFGAHLVLYIAGRQADDLPETLAQDAELPGALRAVVNAGYGLLRAFVQHLPLDAHADEMAQGIFQPQDVAYYLLFSAFFIFLTFRALESRNWRG